MVRYIYIYIYTILSTALIWGLLIVGKRNQLSHDEMRDSGGFCAHYWAPEDVYIRAKLGDQYIVGP